MRPLRVLTWHTHGSYLHYLTRAPFAARYRFLFNPIRYTSLGLAVIEAMMIGMPVVALGTTDMVSAAAHARALRHRPFYRRLERGSGRRHRHGRQHATKSNALRRIALLSEHASALAQAAVATTYTR